MTPKRILLVEDEQHLAAGLKLNFEMEGYEADVATSAKAATRLLATSQGYDVMILDVMLPDLDGFELCRRIREAGNVTPIIMLTARSQAADRVLGLEAGADDYLVKPFELSELLARVQALLRRQSWEKDRESQSSGAPPIEFGEATVDFASHTASCGGREVRLTVLEMKLLRYFYENAGRVLSRDELLEKVWGMRNYPNVRIVDNFIVRLRKHFEADPTAPAHFISVRGAGYKFVQS